MEAPTGTREKPCVQALLRLIYAAQDGAPVIIRTTRKLYDPKQAEGRIVDYGLFTDSDSRSLRMHCSIMVSTGPGAGFTRGLPVLFSS